MMNGYFVVSFWLSGNMIKYKDFLDRYVNGYYKSTLVNPVKLDFINENLCRMLGYTPEEQYEIFGSYYGLMVLPEDRHILDDMISCLSKKEGTLNATYRMMTKDGSFKYVLDTMVSTMEDGIMRGYSTVIDVTDIVSVGNESKAIGDFLTKSGVATFEFYTKDLRLETSKALDDFLGYQLSPKWFHQIYERTAENPEFDYQKLLNTYNKVLVTADFQKVELPLRIKGKNKWITVAMTPLMGFDKTISGVFGTVSDSTRKHREKEIHETQEHLIHTAIKSKYPMAISLNITNNRYHIIYGETFMNIVDKVEGRIDELLAAVVEKMPLEYREDFIRILGKDNVIDAYNRGEKKIIFDYNENIDKVGEMKSLHFELSFIDVQGQDDILATFLLEDVTDIKEKELLLEREYQFTIENMPGYVCKWRFEENDIVLTDANSSFYNFMQTSKEEAVGKSIIYGFTEEKKKEVIDIFFGAARDKRHLHYTGIANTARGLEHWVTVHGTYYGMQDGMPVYYVVMTDITAVERLKDEMERKEKELKYAADLGENTVLEYNVHERKIEVLSVGRKAKGFYALDGHAPEYALEKKLVPFLDDSSFYDSLIAIEHGSKSGSIQFAVESFDEIKWYSGKYKTLFNEENEPISAVIYLNDTTDFLAMDALRMIETVMSDFLNKTQLLQIVNLETGYIEHESGNSLLLESDEVVTFESFKEQKLNDCLVGDEYVDSWSEFLNVERLKKLYRSGKVQDKFNYRCKGNVENCETKEMEIHIKLQKNSYDNVLRAYILYENLHDPNMGLTENEKKDEVISGEIKKVSIRTFGHFDVFVDDEPLLFSHEKAKEMLAVLVDRRGGFVGTDEMLSYLWEDELPSKATKARCRQTAARMNKILEENGIGGIVENTNGKRRIIPERIDCDYYNYINNREKYQSLFRGSYMSNYSWGEYTLASLENERFSY